MHAAIEFEDATIGSGLEYSGETYGASWGDVNNDDWPDLFINHHRNMPGLYINNQNGTFTDEGNLIATWTNNPERDTHGGTFADFDNDGDDDLMVSTGRGSPNQFFVNDNGVLTDQTVAYNIEYVNWAGRMAVWFDQNGDGLLDFSMSNFSSKSPILTQGVGTFNDITDSTGANCTLMPYAQLLDITGDEKLDLLCGRQGKFPYQAYETSNTPFTDIAANIPLVWTTMDTLIADFDNNLEQDVIYTRAVVRSADVAQAGPNGIEAALVSGSKGFTFVSGGVLSVDLQSRRVRDEGIPGNIRIGSAGYEPADAAFVLDPADPANHGMPIYDTSENPILLIGFDTAAQEWSFIQYTGSEWSYMYLQVESSQAVTNTQAIGLEAEDGPFVPVLHMQNADVFTDNANNAGLAEGIQCSSIAAADFDNDMDVDLYMACRSGVRNLPNRLYENQGNGVFDLVPGAGGAEGPIGVAIYDGAGTADSVIAADYDIDGFIDLFVTNGLNLEPEGLGGPDKLFRNKGNGNRWIQLDLEGTTTNRDGIGARVVATAGGVSQLREQNGGYHRWSQNDRRLHFGLAGNATVDITVDWPSGQQDTFADVAVDAVYRVTEGAGITALSVGQPNQSTLSIADASASEADASMTFSVSLFPASQDTVSIDFATVSGTAAAGADFETAAGTLNFLAGETLQQVTVSMLDDDLIEGNEEFTVSLTNAVNAPLSNNIATGTIQDNEVDVCNAPTIDPSSDRGAFLWRDCSSGVWQAQFTAGDGAYVKYIGSITSSLNFLSVVGTGLEANDILDNSDPAVINYELGMSSSFDDRFEFSYPEDSSVCFDVTSPDSTALLVGADKVAVSLPMDPETLGECMTGDGCHP